jgi:hypothetical protein
MYASAAWAKLRGSNCLAGRPGLGGRCNPSLGFASPKSSRRLARAASVACLREMSGYQPRLMSRRWESTTTRSVQTRVDEGGGRTRRCKPGDRSDRMAPRPVEALDLKRRQRSRCPGHDDALALPTKTTPPKARKLCSSGVTTIAAHILRFPSRLESLWRLEAPICPLQVPRRIRDCSVRQKPPADNVPRMNL